MASRIIAVVGATGAQGGGLARAILDDQDGGFTCRALTRKPDSRKARALADRGAEIVKADLDDPASIEKAFAGAYGAFCLTSFWEHFSGNKEKEQAKTMAAAAKKAGIRHAIWSTFEDTRKWVPLSDDRMPTLQGEYKVAHFDAKGEADGFFREQGVPTTFLRTSGYYENFIHFGWGPQKLPDGKLALVFPLDDAKMPMIAVEDIGRCAYAIFKRGDEFIGKTLGIAGDHLSGSEMAAAVSDAIGRDVGYTDVPADVYRGFDFPGADDAGNMLQFKRDFADVYRGNRSVEKTRELNPRLQSFRDWLKQHAKEIPIPE